MEIKIPKEVRKHKETIFFGLTARQFFCAVAAVALAAAPLAVAGFFHYNGMTLEQFVWAVVKSELLFAGGRPFASENFYYDLLHRKGGQDFD